MGFPMAGHLAAAGHAVTVWNRSPDKARLWSETYGGAVAKDPASAVKGADFVVICVGDDPDVLAVYDAIAEHLKPGAIVIDHTTASADLARSLSARAVTSGHGFLDAPISGGQAGAVNAKLTIMVGGDETAFARARAVLDVYAKQVTHVGPSGAGQLCKMVNQICIAGAVQGVAEGLHFAKRAGLDTEKVLAAISQGSAQSWQMENRWPTMSRGEFAFGFAVDWMRKDLRIALSEARNNGASLQTTALIDQFYAEVQKLGGARWDTSSLIARLEDPKEDDRA
jgi:3-hydroxyisobutyrate dehydrogenase-like beta-hydroxyacid dehydrogenase